MRIRTGLQTVALGLLLSAPTIVFGSGQTPAASSHDNNATLDSRVHHAIEMLPYYGVFDELSYRVDGDKVTLFGQVADINLKRDADSAVKHVEGVRSFESHVEVLPLSRFDNDIRLRTFRAIYGYPPLNKYDFGVRPPIHILVKDGNVTLTGVVDSKMDRDMVYLRANAVPGSFSVTNNLQINP